MKISTTGLYQIERETQKQSKFQAPLNPKAMDLPKAIIQEQYITIPYADPALLQDENIQQLVTHIAEQTDWAFPDYERTKFNLVFEVNEDFEIMGTLLQVIAQPHVYTEQEKVDILKQETDDEMYITWQEIFYYADDFYKNEDRQDDDNKEEIEFVLSEDVLNELANIVTSCI